MFEVKRKAEVKGLNVRCEVHGDEFVPAVDVSIMCIDVPAESVGQIVEQFEERFYEGDQPVMPEVWPLKVNHKVQNVRAVIGTVEFGEADLKGAEVTPKVGKVCDVAVKVQSSALADGMLDQLAHMLRLTVDVEIVERQARFEEMDQD